MGNSAQAFQRFLGFGSAFGMAEVAQAQPEHLDFFGIGAPLPDTVGFRQLVQAVDDFDRQLAVRRVGDVLFLDRGVDMDAVLQGGFALQGHAHLEQPFHTFLANPLAKVGEFRTVARQIPAELGQAAECLMVGILLESQHHLFVTQIFQLLQ